MEYKSGQNSNRVKARWVDVIDSPRDSPRDSWADVVAGLSSSGSIEPQTSIWDEGVSSIERQTSPRGEHLIRVAEDGELWDEGVSSIERGAPIEILGSSSSTSPVKRPRPLVLNSLVEYGRSSSSSFFDQPGGSSSSSSTWPLASTQIFYTGQQGYSMDSESVPQLPDSSPNLGPILTQQTFEQFMHYRRITRDAARPLNPCIHHTKFLKGKRGPCPFGDACTFSHDDQGERRKNPLMRVCQLFKIPKSELKRVAMREGITEKLKCYHKNALTKALLRAGYRPTI